MSIKDEVERLMRMPEVMQAIGDLSPNDSQSGARLIATVLKASNLNPARWIRVDEQHGYVAFSRCQWMYPQSTEGDAGPRDEARYKAVDGWDGDIILSFGGPCMDSYHLAKMLEFQTAPHQLTIEDNHE